MTAYCCFYYLDGYSMKSGVAKYCKGKISIYDKAGATQKKWIENFELSYSSIAEEIKYPVLRGDIDPLVVPGLFLK